jgi:hypothetical protein
VVAGTLLVATPGLAGGEDAVGARIRWSAPPECPDEAALRAEIERLLARPLFASDRRLSVHGEVARAPGAEARYLLRLTLAVGLGPVQERRLEDASCALVARAAAVVVALAIDAESPPPEPEPEPPAPEPVPAPSASPPAAAIADSPAPWRAARGTFEPAWEMAAVAGVDAASLPAVAAGVGLRVARDLGADRIELAGTAWPPRRVALPHLPAVGADVALYTGGLRYCRWLVGGAFDAAACGGLEAGALVASGFGAATSTSGLGRWLAPQLGLLGRARVTSRFALSLGVEGLALAFRDRFTILGAGEVYRPPPATARATIGAQLRFP